MPESTKTPRRLPPSALLVMAATLDAISSELALAAWSLRAAAAPQADMPSQPPQPQLPFETVHPERIF
jgi:hypothetical protein